MMVIAHLPGRENLGSSHTPRTESSGTVGRGKGGGCRQGHCRGGSAGGGVGHRDEETGKWLLLGIFGSGAGFTLRFWLCFGRGQSRLWGTNVCSTSGRGYSPGYSLGRFGPRPEGGGGRGGVLPLRMGPREERPPASQA